MPLVLDDVFVNFDAGRARAAAGVLRDFAAEERGPYLCRLNHFLIVRCQADEIAVIRADDVILTGGSRQRRDAFPILPHAVQIKKTY